jgi:hypothetical protein
VTVTAELVNVFLQPDEAAALPVRVELYYTSTRELAELAPDNPFVPVLSARASLDLVAPFDSVDAAKRGLAWLAEVLAFATRRPTGAVTFITSAEGVEGTTWERAGLPRLGNRTGDTKMFRSPGDLRLIVERAMNRPAADLEESGIEHALVLQNLARRETGLQYLDIRLLHQWIPLEILASKWAEREGRGRLLGNGPFNRLKRDVRQWMDAEDLGASTRAEVESKLTEVKRRPSTPVLLEFVRETLGPFDRQPVGDELDDVVGRSIRARNQAVHAGAVDFDAVQGTSGAHRDLMRIAGITERVLLAILDAPIPYLTDVPWTSWRAGA